jgi:large subunit ribosomal protein L2
MKTYKPVTPGRRGMTVVSYRDHLTTTKNRPHKALTRGKRSTGGRNAQGRTTNFYQGNGVKRKYRDIDFTYAKKDMEARVESVEYDPFRTAFVALVCYKDGTRAYIVAPKGMKANDTFIVSEDARVKMGNRLPLRKIPIGTFVYNVELKPNAGGRIARSAGNYAEVVAQDAGYTLLKMPSTEVRKVLDTCWASIGGASNDEHHLTNLGKAGRSRWMGLRPKNRGSARNAVDHPHGGGEGRMGRGHRRSRTVHGRPTGKGQKTRRPKKYSNIHIVSRRKPGPRMSSKGG